MSSQHPTRSEKQRRYIQLFVELVKFTKLKPFTYSDVSHILPNTYMSRFSHSKLIYNEDGLWNFAPDTLDYIEHHMPSQDDYLTLIEDITEVTNDE